MARDASGNRQESSGASRRGRKPGEQAGKREQLGDRALAALLSEPTIAQAAAKADVSESTLLRWLKDPAFSAAYRAARRSAVDAAVGRLQQAATEAVDALERNLRCGNPAVEVGAAKAVLDQAFRGVELADLAQRVQELEQAAEQAKGRR